MKPRNGYLQQTVVSQVIWLAGVVLVTGFFAALSDQQQLASVSLQDLPRLDADAAYRTLRIYHDAMKEEERVADQQRREITIQRKTDIADNALRSLRGLLAEPLTALLDSKVDALEKAQHKAFSLRVLSAFLVAVLFVVAPLFYYGPRLWMVVPAACAVTAALFSCDSASRLALIGAFAFGVAVCCKQAWHQHRTVSLHPPAFGKLVLGCSVACVPVFVFAGLGIWIGGKIDRGVDYLVDQTEAAMSRGVSAGSAAVQQAAHAQRGPWYSLTEIFIYKPMRRVVLEHTGTVANTVSRGTGIFYSSLRAMLQLLRFLSLFTTGWAVCRLAVALLAKAFLYAGGTIEFGLSPNQ